MPMCWLVHGHTHMCVCIAICMHRTYATPSPQLKKGFHKLKGKKGEKGKETSGWNDWLSLLSKNHSIVISRRY